MIVYFGQLVHHLGWWRPVVAVAAVAAVVVAVVEAVTVASAVVAAVQFAN